MSQSFRLSGKFLNTTHQTIQTALQPLFPDLALKVRVFGYDLKYSNADIELHISTTQNNEAEYFIDLSAQTVEAEFNQLAEQIIQLLQSQKINYIVDYYEIDEAGDPVGEENTFFSPQYS